MPIDDTYNWNELSPATNPSARAGQQMVWDGTRIIMFGGANAGGYLNDTWEYVADNWNQLSPATSPPVRAFHAMAWDGSRILLWGGRNSTHTLQGFDDTWEFDGTDWTDLSPATTPPAIPPAFQAGMVWDGTRFVMSKWHYNSPYVSHLNDTYEFTGGDWNLLTPSPEGPHTSLGRQISHFAMVDHGASVIVTGGKTSTNATNDFTSEYDGTDWAELAPATVPGTHRSAAQIAYDGARSFLFAGDLATVGTIGQVPTNDSWLWDGTNWELFNPADKPEPRYWHSMIWDGDRILMFGGFDDSPTTYYGDLWELAATATPAGAAATISHIFGLGT